MPITPAANLRGPILDLELPARVDTVHIFVRNLTTGQALRLNLPEGWGGKTLSLDFFRRTIKDSSGADQSALLDPVENSLWNITPLLNAANVVKVEIVGDATFTWTGLAAGNSTAIAVDATYIYWASQGTKKIGRAKLDGTEINYNFISLGIEPWQLAVDAGHIYWGGGGFNRIGRATIAGGSVEEKWIELESGSFVSGLAIDAGHIYWATGTKRRIGRATIAGGTKEEKWIELAAERIPRQLAVDAGHIYWTDLFLGTIGRATIAGGSVEEKWIVVPEGNLAGALVNGLAVDAKYVYWSDSELRPRIGRAKINGTSIEAEYVQAKAKFEPQGIAVDATCLYWGYKTTIGIGRLPFGAVSYAAKAKLRWEKGYY